MTSPLVRKVLIVLASFAAAAALSFSLARANKGMMDRGMLQIGWIEDAVWLNHWGGFFCLALSLAFLGLHVDRKKGAWGLELVLASWLIILGFLFLALSMNLIPIYHVGHWE